MPRGGRVITIALNIKAHITCNILTGNTTTFAPVDTASMILSLARISSEL